MSTPVKSFTAASQGLMNVLKTTCSFTSAFDPATHVGAMPQVVSFDAIWDTGASASVISQNIVDALGLQPLSMTQVHTAGGLYPAEVYKVNIGLPNGVMFKEVSVTKAPLPPGSDSLIGMDIIGSGDFAVTNKGGKTVFTFRCPSVVCIDFVAETQSQSFRNAISAPQRPPSPRIGRNDRCPCQSGKKHKHCCGKTH
jgi:predicted aspartyl protease